MTTHGERDDRLDYDQLFPGRFIKAGEFGGKDVTLTIAEIHLEALPQDKGGDRVRGVIQFKETQKGWVLNRTNGECLKAMWGRAPNEWVGRKVTLYPTMVQFGKSKELGIRVRGSPELESPIEAEVKLPKRKPVTVTLIPTGRGRAATPQTQHEEIPL